MKILYPFPEPLPIAKARAIQAVKTVTSLAAGGAEVVFAYVPTGADPFARYGVVRHRRIETLPLSRSLPFPLSGLKVHSNRLFLWRLSAVLRGLQRQGKAPEAILVRHLKLAAGLLHRHPELPLIYEAHEVFADGASGPKAERLAALERCVLEKAAGVIAISRALADSLRWRYGTDRSMAIIPSATELPTQPAEKDWRHAEQQIVYSGSLFPWKGAQDIIDAAASLEGYEITMIGGEPQRIHELQERVASKGATVRFLGHMDHAAAVANLAPSCIALLPNRAGSVSEFTSPLKLFEYMAAGCAVVASDLPVFREVLADDEASWFEQGNAESLAAAIRRLAEDPQTARVIGERLREKAAGYTWEARAERLSQAIASAILARRQDEGRRNDK